MIMDGNILMVKLVLKQFFQVAIEKDLIKLSPSKEITSTITTNGSTNPLAHYYSCIYIAIIITAIL